MISFKDIMSLSVINLFQMWKFSHLFYNFNLYSIYTNVVQIAYNVHSRQQEMKIHFFLSITHFFQQSTPILHRIVRCLAHSILMNQKMTFKNTSHSSGFFDEFNRRTEKNQTTGVYQKQNLTSNIIGSGRVARRGCRKTVYVQGQAAMLIMSHQRRMVSSRIKKIGISRKSCRSRSDLWGSF